MSRVTVKTVGFREMDDALLEFAWVTAKAIARRALKTAAEPILSAARARAHGSIAEDLSVGFSLSKRQRSLAGKAAKVVMGPDGPTFRSAKSNLVEIHIGPKTPPGGKAPSPAGLFEEFGTINLPPQGFMRSAWAQNKTRAFDIIREELAGEIERSRRRAARKALRG